MIREHINDFSHHKFIFYLKSTMDSILKVFNIQFVSMQVIYDLLNEKKNNVVVSVYNSVL